MDVENKRQIGVLVGIVVAGIIICKLFGKRG